MASVNKVILLGNVGKDPEVRYTAGGETIANVSLATSEKWKDKASGEMQEKTEWHRLSFFGRLAEIVGEFVQKGSSIYVEGNLTTRKWTDKDGNDRFSTEVRVGNLQMLSKGGGGEREQAPPRRSRPAAQAQRGVADMDDDIPF